MARVITIGNNRRSNSGLTPISISGKPPDLSTAKYDPSTNTVIFANGHVVSVNDPYFDETHPAQQEWLNTQIETTANPISKPIPPKSPSSFPKGPGGIHHPKLPRQPRSPKSQKPPKIVPPTTPRPRHVPKPVPPPQPIPIHT